MLLLRPLSSLLFIVRKSSAPKNSGHQRFLPTLHAQSIPKPNESLSESFRCANSTAPPAVIDHDAALVGPGIEDGDAPFASGSVDKASGVSPLSCHVIKKPVVVVHSAVRCGDPSCDPAFAFLHGLKPLT